jgi:hypothetical protein
VAVRLLSPRSPCARRAGTPWVIWLGCRRGKCPAVGWPVRSLGIAVRAWVVDCSVPSQRSKRRCGIGRYVVRVTVKPAATMCDAERQPGALSCYTLRPRTLLRSMSARAASARATSQGDPLDERGWRSSPPPRSRLRSRCPQPRPFVASLSLGQPSTDHDRPNRCGDKEFAKRRPSTHRRLYIRARGSGGPMGVGRLVDHAVVTGSRGCVDPPRPLRPGADQRRTR